MAIPAKESTNILISTLNGTGSSTTNQILHKLLAQNYPYIAGKNIFPSNIAGLPTLYSLRVHNNVQPTFSNKYDLWVCWDDQNYLTHLENLTPKATVILNKDLKLPIETFSNFNVVEVSPRTLFKEFKLNPKLKKNLSNIIYLALLNKILSIPMEHVEKKLKNKIRSTDIYQKNIEVYLKAQSLDLSLPKITHTKVSNEQRDKDELIISGNEAGALGAFASGCQFASWYPITPSSSFMEAFDQFSKQSQENNLASVHQTEDEISAAVSCVGAAWTGARSLTATSGPGLSLMNEAIGLAYFTEIPLVVWDIQRAGPATGLPTRTAQGDLSLINNLSHGDTNYPILLPSCPEECFAFAGIAHDVADEFQTPVFVLSDLDIGMNLWKSKKLKAPNTWNRGSYLFNEEEIPHGYKPYKAQDLKIKRVLPGTTDATQAFLTRGSGHNENGVYSESPEVYNKKIIRLKNKINSSTEQLPKDLFNDKKSPYTLILWGSSRQAIDEIKFLANKNDLKEFNVLEIMSLPLHKETKTIIESSKVNLVIEQNANGQMNQIIKSSIDTPINTVSIKQCDGQPIMAAEIYKQIKKIIEKYESQPNGKVVYDNKEEYND